MHMIVGTHSLFAIESDMTVVFERLSFRALGFFTIHVGGRQYGVVAPDATMLACSFKEVGRRIARRGTHVAPFATEPDAGAIADGVRDAIYAPDMEETRFFGIPQPEFYDQIFASNILWAPDGDEAFDDGSFVLHFDVDDRVRLIGFKSLEGYHHTPGTLSDVWMEADEFYGILQRWYDDFEAAWIAAPKVSEN